MFFNIKYIFTLRCIRTSQNIQTYIENKLKTKKFIVGNGSVAISKITNASKSILINKRMRIIQMKHIIKQR